MALRDAAVNGDAPTAARGGSVRRVVDQNPQVVEVGGRRMRLTSLEKVLYPSTGTTKAEVIDYYVRVSDPLLRQLADRPVTRIRWPHGTGDPEQFFEKNVPPGTPKWVRTATLPTSPRDSDSGRTTITYPLLDDVPSLVWTSNLSALELHTPQWRVGDDGRPADPDRLVVDLDPGEGTGLPECSELAHLVAERLADDGLHDPVPVTSGGKGMQLYVDLTDGTPLGSDADAVREYARGLAEGLAKDHRRTVTATMTKSLRRGKVLLDWSQNHAAKTTITPYSLRGRARPTVAAPRRWDELGEDLEQLTYTEVLDRLDEDGDLMP
ncbi:non-homologous end-joining DNA ligase [Thalassiella azotivora]